MMRKLNYDRIYMSLTFSRAWKRRFKDFVERPELLNIAEVARESARVNIESYRTKSFETGSTNFVTLRYTTLL
jgi:hypothetical protein